MTDSAHPRRALVALAAAAVLGVGLVAFNSVSRESSTNTHFTTSLTSLPANPLTTSDSSTTTASTTASTPTLIAQTEYELASGRKLAADYEWDGTIVQVHKTNLLSLSSGEECVWSVNGETQNSGEPASSISYTFTRLDDYTVECGDYSYTAYSRVVRREIRDLTEKDRSAYFDAVVELYTVTESDGKSMYGETFQSANELLKIHLAGAADKSCDHWHDDAGMLNHHVGVTWKFEQSLRLIDSSTASHYWDYTREAANGQEWYESEMFADDWFGSSSPNHPDHVLNKGRFAYLHVMTNAREFSAITNPYGILRAPWNTNPVPFLMRSNVTAGMFADGFKSFPTCDNFASLAGESLDVLNVNLNGMLHGPVHIMVGGHWGMEPRLVRALQKSSLEMGSDLFLLLSKYLWRQGVIRLPETCSTDTPAAQCKPSCPTEIIGTDITSEEFLERYGLSSASDRIQELFDIMRDEQKMTDSEIIMALCQVGYPGEMFTSAAPQDPLFWPVHGPLERFVQSMRLWKSSANYGDFTFDETWGYYHIHGIPSDTHRVCDWTDVSGLEMPKCDPEVCDGHRLTDVLPFVGLHKAQASVYTNVEFYDLTHPNNNIMPYVYDSLDYWAGCSEGSSLYQTVLVKQQEMPAQVPDQPADSPSESSALPKDHATKPLSILSVGM